MCTHLQNITITMTEFDDVFVLRFLPQRGVRGDENQAVDSEQLLDEGEPNISCSVPDWLAGVSITSSGKEEHLLYILAESIAASMPSSVLA
jgi:hypothetical protein